MSFVVLKPGALSMLQDLGRYGHQRFGVLVGGAMDEWSHRLANALVCNDENDATLEMVLSGPSLQVERTLRLAVCGAALSPTVTGRTGTEPLPHGRPVWIREGARIDFGARSAGSGSGGVRAYLAVQGGFDVPPVMGSRSTYLRGGFGGLQGRALRKGDALSAAAVSTATAIAPATSAITAADPPSNARFSRSVSGSVALPASPIIVPRVELAPVQTVRLIRGQQWDVFTEQAHQQLLGGEYRVGLQSDRMGYRLEGAVLERARAIEMISESVTFGTIQVPPDGLPIVLMADRQTTGGYPKIANVASADLGVMAQMAPRQPIRFQMISLADAQRILLARDREYSHVRQVMLADAMQADPPLTRPTGTRRNRR